MIRTLSGLTRKGREFHIEIKILRQEIKILSLNVKILTSKDDDLGRPDSRSITFLAVSSRVGSPFSPLVGLLTPFNLMIRSVYGWRGTSGTGMRWRMVYCELQ